jgi:DNA-binding protein YbaB
VFVFPWVIISSAALTKRQKQNKTKQQQQQQKPITKIKTNLTKTVISAKNRENNVRIFLSCSNKLHFFIN